MVGLPVTRTQPLPITPCPSQQTPTPASARCPPPRPVMDALSPTPSGLLHPQPLREWPADTGPSAPEKPDGVREACPWPRTAQPWCRNPDSLFLKCPRWAATSWTRLGGRASGNGGPSPKSQAWDTSVVPASSPAFQERPLSAEGRQTGATQPIPANESLPLKGF